MGYFIAQSPVMLQKCNHSDNNFPLEKRGCENGTHINVMFQLGFPGGSDNKESTCNVGDLGLICLNENLFSSCRESHARYKMSCPC